MREPSAWDYDDQEVVEVKNEAAVARSRPNLYVAKDAAGSRTSSYNFLQEAGATSPGKVDVDGALSSGADSDSRGGDFSDSDTTHGSVSSGAAAHVGARRDDNPNDNPNALLSQNSFSFTDVTQEGHKPLAEAFQPLQHMEAREVKYKPPALRGKLQECLASQRGSVSDVHCEDTLRRVSVVVHRHILICERRHLARQRKEQSALDSSVSYTVLRGLKGHRRSRRLSNNAVNAQILTLQRRGSGVDPGLLDAEGEEEVEGNVEAEGEEASAASEPRSKSIESGSISDSESACELLCEDNYLRTYWKYTFLQLPRLPLWTPHRIERIERKYEMPTVERIYNFLHNLFTEAELSSECCVISLIYVERLMERSGLQLLSNNWHPVLLCCMLLASKVWQDLSSWNVEFARICPQYSNKSINKMERNVLQLLKWDLFISGSLYAKYYFALRSLSESRNFRRRYNYIMRVNHNKLVEEKSAQVASDLYSKSM